MYDDKFFYENVKREDKEFEEDDWVQVTCLDDKHAYLFLGELIDEHKPGAQVEGVLKFEPEGYDVVHDLAEKEKADLEQSELPTPKLDLR